MTNPLNRSIEDRKRLGEKESFVPQGLEITFGGRYLKPISKNLRIVKDDTYDYSHRFDLEALDGGEWKIVYYYDNGQDDYGQLNPPEWKRLGSSCAWTEDSLQRFTNGILKHLGYRSAERKVLLTLEGLDEPDKQKIAMSTNSSKIFDDASDVLFSPLFAICSATCAVVSFAAFLLGDWDPVVCLFLMFCFSAVAFASDACRRSLEDIEKDMEEKNDRFN